MAAAGGLFLLLVSVLTCELLFREFVPDMTYNVFGGTLNLAQLKPRIHQLISTRFQRNRATRS